ncbi:MAG: ABC transporter ATP-binding protein [Clostridia bacterium]|nr:ABC transporter ATP-binding protein [Clostridia bacterium]
MFKLMKFLSWKEWLGVFLVLIVISAEVYVGLQLVEYMGNIVRFINEGALLGDMSIYWNDILTNGGLMLLMVAINIACLIIASLVASIVTSNLAAKIRRNIFKKVNSFSMSEINKFSVASLITRSTNDITQFQQVFNMILTVGVMAPLMAILAIAKIVGLSTELSIVTAIAIGVLILLLMMVFFLVVPKFKFMQKYTDKINLVARENLTGIRVVRANNAEEFQEEKFEDVNKNFTKTNIYINRVTAMITPIISSIMSITMLAIIWVSATLIINNPSNASRQIQVMTMFTQYAMQIIMSFMILSMMFIMIPRSIVSSKRINEVLDAKNTILNGAGIPNDLKQKGEIIFKNVSFKYPDAEKNVLTNISFEAKKGETVAFIGSTGSGKSTLVNLIPRFYDCVEGEILVDGYDVREYDLNQLNDKIGYIPQKGILFSGSIEENLKYGKKNATEQEVNEAIEVSQAKFIYDLEDGTTHHISQGGKNISGGQRQRLSIARAIVKNPEIYIFDDSFSALDYKTDKELRKALRKHTKDSTVLIVAQRIGTIRDADKIIVLDKGEIVGIGKHKGLLKSCPIYKEIALSQLSKEEL